MSSVTALTVLVVCSHAATSPRSPVSPVFPALRVPPAEILWDTYGIPHIYASDVPSLGFAFGWAQAQAHGDLLLRLYGQARGRAAEYWGEDHLDEDRWVWTLGAPERARRWYADQRPEFRAYLDAFAAGVNAYATAHSAAIADSVEVVLPVDASDALMHLHRITYSFFLANRNQARGWERGSNAWAIAPKRSASGRAMLLANPHLPWSDVFTWFEAHLNAPGIRAYGAALVGMPVLPIAFNERLGWTHTVNTQDGNDVYELTLQERGYRWDGGVRSFEQESRTLRVREKNGAFRDETLIVRRSVHGPVIGEKPGKALALRVVGFDHGFAFEQWWDMARARSLAEFETAISRMQVSGQNITYADADGRILYHYGGNTPVRSRADRGFWQRVVPGDTSATLWTALHGYADMPRVVDPPSGWVQNANDPPWHATVPPGMSPSQYPAYLAPVTLSSRPQQSIRLLMADSSITFDELVEYKHSTRMGHADRVLEPLLAAARGSTDSLIGAAAQILAGWDRAADAESRGAVLFQEWWYEYADRLRGRSLFAEPWNPQRPLDTPSGLGRPDTAVAALAAAAERVRARHGRLDVSWGAVHRVRRDGLDFPGNGGPGDLGVFRVVGYDSTSQGRIAESGDSYVVVIEFGDPVRAMALVGYGNWSQPNTPHRTDQLALFAEKRLRSVWLDRASVERNLERREWVTIPESAAGGRR